MQGNINPRVIGATIIGFALVAGAYVTSNILNRSFDPTVNRAAVVSTETTPRTAITVVDSDQNGIEDWRDQFVETEPIVLEPLEPVEEYVPPDTLTGELGVNFIESYLTNKTRGELGRSEDQLISDTIDILASETAHDIYDLPDITIMDGWSDGDILTYANTIARSLINNDIEDIQPELFILDEVMQSESNERIADLNAISVAYARMRDDMLATPVPRFLVKEHLNLINTYHAVHKDIEAMTLGNDDPAFTLMRLKRYEDDAMALGFALTDMYEALVPYGSLAGPDDPALLFIAFSPQVRS